MLTPNETVTINLCVIKEDKQGKYKWDFQMRESSCKHKEELQKLKLKLK